MTTRPARLMTLILPFALATPALAVTPAELCQSAKNKSAGQYDSCRLKAESTFAKTGDAAKYAAALLKCAATFNAKWPTFEAKAVAQGGVCPSVGDQTAVRTFIESHTTDLAIALAGGGLPNCSTDLTACQGNLSTCNGGLATCQADLTACQNTAGGGLLKTGVTTCADTAGAPIACAGTGQDGELQRGLARTYTDNGNGTITDTRTGLMWEKLDRNGSVHDRDTTYTWAAAFAKITALNGAAFGGHTDWRLPNINELQSLADYSTFNPAIGAQFDTGCVFGCTVLTCSCTGPNDYWSSTIALAIPGYVYSLYAGAGIINANPATTSNLVRAVRAGS
jgi:Protein of unknown function (DUF1566)